MNSRSRTFTDTTQNVDTQWYLWYGCTGNPAQDSSTSNVVAEAYDKLDDVHIPNFHKRVKAGELFFNPFRRVTTSKTGSSGIFRYDYNNGDCGTRSGDIGIFFVDIAWPTLIPDFGNPLLDWDYDVKRERSNDLNDLIANSRQQVLARVDASDYDFGEDLAEIGKTLASLGKIFSQVSDIMRDTVKTVKKLSRRSKRDPVDVFAEVWLRARYEIRPLLISGENIIEVAREGIKVRGTRRVARHSTSDHQVTDQTLDKVSGTSTFTWRKEETLKTVVSSGIMYDDANPIDTLLEQLGLGFKDLIPTIWAVTKFSFLIDRFIDVASLIEGVQNSIDPNIRYKGAWTTVERKYTTTTTLSSVTMSDRTVDTGQAAVTNTVHTIERLPYTPSISDSIPVFHWATDWANLIDLFAIFGAEYLKLPNAKTLRI